jgi:CBS domain-containing protein
LLRDRADDTAQHLVTRLSRELSATADGRPRPGTLPPTETDDAPRVRVSDVMTSDVTMVAASASLRTAAAVLFSEGISGAPVVGDDGALVGVVSEHDLLARQAPPASGLGRRVAEQRRRHYAQSVAAACSLPAVVVAPDASVRDAAQMMLEHNIARLVVTEGGAIVGIVTRHDVLAALLRADDLVAATIDRMLRDRNEPGVTATVVDGVVALKGAVRMRSVATGLPRIVGGLDGVVSVETNLRWDTDDTRPVVRTH